MKILDDNGLLYTIQKIKTLLNNELGGIAAGLATINADTILQQIQAELEAIESGSLTALKNSILQIGLNAEMIGGKRVNELNTFNELTYVGQEVVGSRSEIVNIAVANETGDEFTNNGTYQQIVENYNVFPNRDIPTFTMKTNDGTSFNCKGSVSPRFLVYNNNCKYQLVQYLNRIEKNNYHYIQINGSDTTDFIAEYDLKSICNVRFSYYVSIYQTCYLESSVDGITWTTIALTADTSTYVDLVGQRYVRFRASNNSQLTIYYAYFTQIILTIPTYKNKFTLTGFNSFTDNQNLKVKTPTGFNLIEVVQNTINDKLVYEILKVNKYYDLIYDNNSFNNNNNKLFLDITLDEDVTQIDIDSLLDPNGAYAISINGKLNSSGNLVIYDNTNNLDLKVGYVDASNSYANGSIVVINNGKPFSFYNYSGFSSYVYNDCKYNAFDLNNLSIKNLDGYTIKAGTNIQIRRLD